MQSDSDENATDGKHFMSPPGIGSLSRVGLCLRGTILETRNKEFNFPLDSYPHPDSYENDKVLHNDINIIITIFILLPLLTRGYVIT